MKQSKIAVIAMGGMMLLACSDGSDHEHSEQTSIVDLVPVALATVEYLDPAKARADGWDLREGLDHCFENEPTGAMGYHYINTAILDTKVDIFMPEAMVYHTAADGRLRFGAVEYIVPADAWDKEGHAGPPEALGHHFHLNAALGVYVLHAWIWKNNPNGLFEDWNPDVSCP